AETPALPDELKPWRGMADSKGRRTA
ncbi:MAG: hypothetical protein ACJA0V_003353, partial [Planctomycetota bacterium]